MNKYTKKYKKDINGSITVSQSGATRACLEQSQTDKGGDVVQNLLDFSKTTYYDYLIFNNLKHFLRDEKEH